MNGIFRRVVPLSFALFASVAIAQAPIAAHGNPPTGGGLTPAGSVPAIAEAVFEMPAGSIAWSVAAIEAGAKPTDVVGNGDAGFVIATQGSVVVRGGDEDETRLEKGEAVAAQPEEELSVQSAGASPARLALLTLGEAAASDQDDAIRAEETFESPEGDREVELLRDVLGKGDAAEIEAGEAPTFVLVTGGSVTIETDDGEPELINAGETTLVDGEVVVTGTAEKESSFVAVVIGEEVSADSVTSSPTPTTRGQSDPRPTTPPANPTPAPPTPTPTPTGNGANDDPDGDGLLNYEEDSFGSDRRNPDTDADILTDGEEVHTYATKPTVLDTDGDGLYDGDEVIRVGSNPNWGDTDGDGLNDFREVNELFTNALDDDTDHDDLGDSDEVSRGTDPRVPDTDGDGIAEGQEVLQYATDPLVYDSDGDGDGDGDEVYYWRTNPTERDTDYDGLSDVEERFLGIDPKNPDTDGDGYGDGAEIYDYDTWPNDPDSHP